jgi:hypothetical protein
VLVSKLRPDDPNFDTGRILIPTLSKILGKVCKFIRPKNEKNIRQIFQKIFVEGSIIIFKL